MSLENEIMTKIDDIESAMNAFQEKANQEIRATGTASAETNTSLDALAIQQLEIADRMLSIEQNGISHNEEVTVPTVGAQFTGSDSFKAFNGGQTQKSRVHIENSTSTGSDATVAPDRKAGIVAGAMEPMSMESVFTTIPTSSDAIQYTRESSFTNNAEETAQAALKPETDIAFELKSMPVSTVAHWTKISKQLAADAPALAAYINGRMIYGLNRRVETQLVIGTGVDPLINGFMNTGNYTLHGYAAADLGATLSKLVLIRKIIADAWNAGYPATAIVMNAADFAQIEIDIFTSNTGTVRFGVNARGEQTLFGLPIIATIGMAVDTFAVGAFGQAGTIHARQGVTLEMSESDGDNFQRNLITVRAERRLALTIEKPAAIYGGDLTPA